MDVAPHVPTDSNTHSQYVGMAHETNWAAAGLEYDTLTSTLFS